MHSRFVCAQAVDQDRIRLRPTRNQRSLNPRLNNKAKWLIGKQTQYMQNHQQREWAMMAREDIEARVRQKQEMEHQLEALQRKLRTLGTQKQRQLCNQVLQCQSNLDLIQRSLTSIRKQKLQIQSALRQTQKQLRALQSMEDDIHRQYEQLQDECNQKYSQAEYRIVCFCDKYNLVKVVKELLAEFRHSSDSKRSQLIAQFLRFARETLISSPKTQQLETILASMKRNYDSITQQGEKKFVQLQSLQQQIQTSKARLQDNFQNFQYKQYLAIKVNQQIYQEESRKAAQELLQAQRELNKHSEKQAERAYNDYMLVQREGFEYLAKKYSRAYAEQYADQAKVKFQTIIRQAIISRISNFKQTKNRIETIKEALKYIKQEVEQSLHQFHRSYMTNTTKTNSFLELQESFQQSLTRQSPYECQGYSDSENRPPTNQRTKISNSRQKRPSAKDRSLILGSLSKSGKVGNLVTEANESLQKRRKSSIEKRRNTLHSVEKHSSPFKVANQYPSSQALLLDMLNDLVQRPARVFIKRYVNPPTIQISYSQSADLGYCQRQLGLTKNIYIEFHIIRAREDTYKKDRTSNSEQTVDWQRIKKIQKTREGLCLTIFLDKGVIDIIFKDENYYIMWRHGLNQLFKHRAILNKIRSKI